MISSEYEAACGRRLCPQRASGGGSRSLEPLGTTLLSNLPKGAVPHHPGPRLAFEYRAKVATGTYPATWTRVPEFTGTEYAFQVRALRDLTIPEEESRC